MCLQCAMGIRVVADDHTLVRCGLKMLIDTMMDKLNIHETAGLTRHAINRGMIQVQ